MVRRRGWGVALVAVMGSALGALAPSVGAQSREALLLPVPPRPSALGGAFGTASPGVSASSPLAFGPGFRDAAGWTERRRGAWAWAMRSAWWRWRWW